MQRQKMKEKSTTLRWGEVSGKREAWKGGQGPEEGPAAGAILRVTGYSWCVVLSRAVNMIHFLGWGPDADSSMESELGE